MILKKVNKLILATITAVTVTGAIAPTITYAADINQGGYYQNENNQIAKLNLDESKIQYISNIQNATYIDNHTFQLDQEKAISLGISNEQILSIKQSYKELNKAIQTGQLNLENDKLSKGDIVENAHMTRAAYTMRWYGVDIWLNSDDCNRLAAILAGGAGAAAVAAGIVTLIPGINAAAIGVATIAGGLLGMGSSILWYASSYEGLNVTITYAGIPIWSVSY